MFVHSAGRYATPACVVLLLLAGSARAETLASAFAQAGPGAGYDRDVVLQTGVTYTGGLWVGRTFNRITAQFEGKGESVRIVGNGAILDLQGGEICCAYCTDRLDISDCVILNGNIRFRGYDGGGQNLVPFGSVRYVTFYGPHDFGVRLTGCGAGILLERNLVVDAVDTGPDYHFLSGMPSDWLPTGASFTPSVQAGWSAYHNWSYHTDPSANADPLRHFCLLCDYG